MTIKAVAFDYGGVISLPQDKKAMEDLARMAGIDTPLMQRMYWDLRPVYDQGLVNGGEFYRNILAGMGIFPDSAVIEQMVERDLESWSRINPGTEQLMKKVKQEGLKLGVLSNMIQPFLDRARKTIPLFDLPDRAVYSCEAGVVKPGEKIYRLLLEALDCRGEELVFFDDLEPNVRAAEKLGIHGYLWKDPAAAYTELKRLCPDRFKDPT
ncbi:MAG: HAD family phosphatase [Spirochaetaceae bacterium]|jgi:putative hydrolase of the HAD superfamily|nr:HAD family phosphatase [Spirochaetaceae bacterium]